jgi:iron complex transport system ATP-binding protein
MKLEIKNAACGYGKKNVLKDISVFVNSGEILCLLGPNGVGKTTLFKTILGFLSLQHGLITLGGTDLSTMPARQFARKLGYVPQAHTPPFPFKVLDVVVMGRTAHMGAFATPSKNDIEIALSSLERLEIGFLKDRAYTEISGGERQMVLIARALTQTPDFLVMDEPTSSLDYGNQIRVLRQVCRLAKDGLGIIMTSHFPDHAFLCTSRVALIKRDGNLVCGNAHDVITEENLKETYGINVKVTEIEGPNGEAIQTCVPLMN